MVNLILPIIVLVLATVNILLNVRIARTYGEMSRRTSTSLAITPESEEGFREFFALCGYGTHGMHVIHVVVDVALILFSTTAVFGSFLIPTIFYLAGASYIHLREAQASDKVLKNFFTRDLAIIEELFTAPRPENADINRDPAKLRDEFS